jgi:GntR family transcriptional repressor for pyruvate dehydrogenase complex
MTRAAPLQMRQPRLAEMIADRLRDDILCGRLKEGDSLPRQEELLTAFQVSLPAVREAMRILENEGLISVRRGKVGGAIVHLPTQTRVAQTISMVLQTRGTTLADVSGSLSHLEPICAGLCAERADRLESVVPALRAAIEAQHADFDDPILFSPNARRFHEAIVANCGSDTMIVVVGSLSAIWSAHESSVWREEIVTVGDEERSSDAPLALLNRHRAVRDHEKLLEAIEQGDSARASSLSAAHLRATRETTLTSSQHETVQANLVFPAAAGAEPPVTT